MGWFARGGRVLEGCGQCPERAWLRIWHAFARMWGGDPEGAQPAFADSVAVGQRCHDIDLLTMSLLGQGMCLILRGHGPAGIALLDELMVAVTAGEVSPMYAGIAYCTVIAGCSDLFDLGRARQWTDALVRWCDAQPDLVPFRGNCLIHRCELMRLAGAWTDAIDAARQACEPLSRPVAWDTLGSAFYQLGELHRLRGDSRRPRAITARPWSAATSPSRAWRCSGWPRDVPRSRLPSYVARWTAAGREPDPGPAGRRLHRGITLGHHPGPRRHGPRAFRRPPTDRADGAAEHRRRNQVARLIRRSATRRLPADYDSTA